jgi:putative peptide zinc metalloprotease protein
MTASASTVAPPGVMPAGRRCAGVPVRARGVQLIGEFAGSGYRESPTLVRRGDGQLIKLTPLLYALIDAIDGRRDSEQLATELGRRVGKQATVDDVGFLIEHKLRPLGVLRQPDGLEPEVERANPLLALRPRVVVSRAELTRRLTVPFVWLFKPLVVIPVLLSFAAVCSWLLIDKGLSSALHQAFYEPGLILVIWALVVLSTAFHEIGHAAACRYGGASPGAIGGGLYLVWPAFYTDVSDTYRLSRGARLRVDLGGLYFSAIFAVATAGLWHLTGADALLLVIAVQLIQVVRQLAPFIRADGYHIVADLVGVPDLFAHIKPTLLGLLPTRWGRGQHKALKPWARAVVTGWVAITVPALVAVLGFIVLAFPRVAASAWDSIGLRWDETTTYWNGGDLAGLAMSGISIALLAIPVLGIVYLVSYMVRRVAVRAWRETAGRPGMRALALLGASALVALIAWAWWPSQEKYRPIDSREPGPVPTVLDPGPPVQTIQLSSLRTVEFATPEPTAIARSIYVLQQIIPYAPQGDAAAEPAPAADGRRDGVPVSPSQAYAPEPVQSGADAPTAAEPAGDPSSTSAWPFPFDPPEPPGPGDNQAMAVNTTDGSLLWDFAISLLILEGSEPVDQVNEAHAYASCTACVTGAVAFQVLLLLEQAQEIVPINAAVAANYACEACETYAFAYQIIASITEAPGPEVQAALDLALQQLQELEESAASLTGLEILLALEGLEQDILDALAAILAVGTATSIDAATQPTSATDGEAETGHPYLSSDSGASQVGSEGAPSDKPDPELEVQDEGAASEVEVAPPVGTAEESDAASSGEDADGVGTGEEPGAASPPEDADAVAAEEEPDAASSGEDQSSGEATTPTPCTQETTTGECTGEAEPAPSTADDGSTP